MGYFSNGSEGMDYEARYCNHCVHQPENTDDGGCPILLLHFLWNYDQCDDETKRTALDTFIPRTEDGLGNQECVMFTRRQK